MNITINSYDKKHINYKPQFKGVLDGALTSVLRTLDTNEVANAALLDLGTMVGPRTYFDAKDRNKYAGGETFVREICGTGINCFAAGVLGGLIANIASKKVMPDVKINPKSWYSEDSLNVLKNIWDNSDNNIQKYVTNLFDLMEGKDGQIKRNFKDIKWNDVEWIDEARWNKYQWDNKYFVNIHNNLKSRDEIIDAFAGIIKDKNISKRDKKQIFTILESRITNALRVNRDLELNIGNYKLNTTLTNIIRDSYDMGKDVFANAGVDISKTIAKIRKVNNIKIFGALSLASLIGISVQKINRKITEKRTGKKGFVGEADYLTKNNNTEDKKRPFDKKFFAKKILASVGMIAMLLGVMKVKNPKDFVKKLQFTGPVSTGNAIKTVYGATIVGRFLAADSENELRESVVRDYFGFLNWLVLGGFASKGVANILDRKQKYLFNIKKEGKGIGHWLNDVSLKTHAEIAAHGKEFAKKNLWKLNLSHIAGLGYSTVMLGIFLPKINIWMTNHNYKSRNVNK